MLAIVLFPLKSWNKYIDKEKEHKGNVTKIDYVKYNITDRSLEMEMFEKVEREGHGE